MGRVKIIRTKKEPGQYCSPNVQWVDSSVPQPYTKTNNEEAHHSPELVPITLPWNPTATLLFHLWPANNWRKHVDYLRSHAKNYDRKIMGVAFDSNTPTLAEVKEAFGDSWEYVSCDNDPKLREVKTYRKMFEMVMTDDPNSVLVCAHGKGAQKHTDGSEPIKWWTETMYETVVGNLPEIFDAISQGYETVGSFRRVGRFFGCSYGYHYSGTFYALRACDFFRNRTVPRLRSRWWGVESLPGDFIPMRKSYCIFADECGDMYYANQQPRKELISWRERNRDLYGDPA